MRTEKSRKKMTHTENKHADSKIDKVPTMVDRILASYYISFFIVISGIICCYSTYAYLQESL